MTSARTRDRLVARLREQGITDNEVLERIRSVPRHLFVDEALASRAYEDTALPIGHGQTISQPYIVARMTRGAARGRQAAQGARGRHRLRLPDGGARAAGGQRLQRRAHRGAAAEGAAGAARSRASATCYMKHGDGFEGWAAHAPFDGIIVAAASLRRAARAARAARGRRPAGDPGRQRPRAAVAAHHPPRRALRAGGARRRRCSCRCCRGSSEGARAGACR